MTQMLNVFRVCSQFTFLGAFAGHFNLDSLTSLFFKIQFVYLIDSNVIQLLKTKTVNKIPNLFLYPVFDKQINEVHSHAMLSETVTRSISVGPVRQIEKNSLTMIPNKLKLEYYIHSNSCFAVPSCKIENCHLKIHDKLKLRYSLRSKILTKEPGTEGDRYPPM